MPLCFALPQAHVLTNIWCVFTTPLLQKGMLSLTPIKMYFMYLSSPQTAESRPELLHFLFPYHTTVVRAVTQVKMARRRNNHLCQSECIRVLSTIFFPSCSLETELGTWQKHAFSLHFKHECLEGSFCTHGPSIAPQKSWILWKHKALHGYCLRVLKMLKWM